MSDHQEIDQLQSDIEQTRGDLAETIGQIEGRLSPSHLQEQVSDLVRQISDQVLAEFTGKSGELTSKINDQINSAMQSVASAKVDQFVGKAGPAVGGAGKSLWNRLADNPAVGALAAVGIGLLAAEEGARRSGGNQSGSNTDHEDASGAASGVASAISGIAGQAGHSISGLLDSARQQTEGRTASDSAADGVGGVGSMLSDASLPSGLVALGIGFLVGMAAPETDAERGVIAPLREQAEDQLGQMGISGGAQGLIESAKRAGGDLIDQGTRAATSTVESAKQTATQFGQQAAETARATVSGT